MPSGTERNVVTTAARAGGGKARLDDAPAETSAAASCGALRCDENSARQPDRLAQNGGAASVGGEKAIGILIVAAILRVARFRQDHLAVVFCFFCYEFVCVQRSLDIHLIYHEILPREFH
jgi:hypothetical protein